MNENEEDVNENDEVLNENEEVVNENEEDANENDEVNGNEEVVNENEEVVNENEEVNENLVVNEMVERPSSSSYHSTRGTHIPFRLPVRMLRDALFETGEEPKRISRRLFEILFYFLLFTSVMLAAYVIHRGFNSADSRRFNPLKWYLPMITAIGCGNVMALAWHLFVRWTPERAVITVFWLSPLMTTAAGFMLMTIESAAGLGIGIPVTCVGLAQALYYCWVGPRLSFAMKIVSAATTVLPDLTTAVILLALATATLYSATLGFAIAGSAAMGSHWDTLAIFGFILSLLWTLHAIKYMVQTMIARIKYKNFAKEQIMPTWWAIGDTIKYLVGSIALGSALVPVFTVIRGPARALQSVFGGSEMFMYSFAYCYNRVATMLPTHGNHYGFVYAGVYNRGFVRASRNAWQVLERSEINELVESDLTGSLCFFTGMTGGAASALVVGSWVRATHQDRVPQVVSFALLIGYLMCRIGTAWVEASVSAYYIAYAENPESCQFENTIRARLEEMRRGQGSHRELELSNRQT